VDIDDGGASVYLNPATPSDVEIVNAGGTTDLSSITCNEAAFDLKITTSTSHGFSAGLPSRQGDLVTWSGSRDNDC